jgi:phospholipid/cholesterol/gamma-HCH transport system ATP-binding protein
MVKFVNIKKSFSGREILKGVSFEVKRGQILFILGTSGTGKSVLLKNIVGLLTPDSGEIYIDSQSIVGLSEKDFQSIRRKCGMVFQHPALFDSLTVFENIAFGLRKSGVSDEQQIKAKVKEALELVHLKSIESRRVTELSYGMQKRVSIARTIVLKPRILLFDEPTTGLDPVMTQVINQLIEELSRKLEVTSLVVSHDMKCALDIADHIIVLDKGNIVDQGKPKELLNSKVELVKNFMLEVYE